MKKISTIFSFYNEAEVLDELISRMEAVFTGELKAYDYELIFVNDVSTDRSLEILRGHRARNPKIKIMTMSRNFGVSPCTIAGMEYSTGDAVIMMDTDLQDPPEQIPDLVRKWEETDADVVYTIRTGRDGEPWAKMAATRMGYKILHRISQIDLPIESGDFRLMSRRAVDHVVQLREKDPFVRGLVRWIGFKQVPHRYRRDARAAGETHFIFYRSKVLKNFLSGITSFSDAPLYMTFALGIAVSAFSFLYLVGIIAMKFIGWNLPGWSAIMATVLFLGGVQILSIGILGLYIAKIHIEVKSRPNYIVSELEGLSHPRHLEQQYRYREFGG